MVWSDAPIPPTSGALSHIMYPKNQRSAHTSNRGAKNDVGPSSVAQNRIEVAARENFLQAVSCSPYRNRITDPHFAEVVERDALVD